MLHQINTNAAYTIGVKRIDARTNS